MKAFTAREIKNLLNLIPDWEYKDEFLQRSFKFDSFKKTITFLNQVADIAEMKKHHPVLINNFNSLQIQLTTHDVKGISQKDFDLALAIDLI
jgi:4a-hydroxytetrahydrobiopterin dehydratase